MVAASATVKLEVEVSPMALEESILVVFAMLSFVAGEFPFVLQAEVRVQKAPRKNKNFIR